MTVDFVGVAIAPSLFATITVTPRAYVRSQSASFSSDPNPRATSGKFDTMTSSRDSKRGETQGPRR